MANGDDQLNEMLGFQFEQEPTTLTADEIRQIGEARTQTVGELMQQIGIKAKTREKVTGVMTQTVEELSEIIPDIELGLRAFGAQTIEEIQSGGRFLRDKIIGGPPPRSLEEDVVRKLEEQGSTQNLSLPAEFIGSAN